MSGLPKIIVNGKEVEVQQLSFSATSKSLLRIQTVCTTTTFTKENERMKGR